MPPEEFKALPLLLRECHICRLLGINRKALAALREAHPELVMMVGRQRRYRKQVLKELVFPAGTT